ncbi:helix-turn-helix domain-containing protein [Sphingomonas quercus]|uniref:Fis family transcriptional regulator n=1 Tax=Sphingomonas quercus TaxID=2842451 RepID=A0ABS6BK50_9SPHN|nr:helix-turn-helix domain-containing protein [Sphingomonas quercus]MBU3078675.1 Fis family transcriptional regulator [Sphingomonas quercus]
MAHVQAPKETSHILLVGEPLAAAEVAAGLARAGREALVIRPADAGMLDRLRERAQGGLVAVDVPIDVSDVLSRLGAGPAVIEGLVGRSVADVERALILGTLARCRGNRTSAATILGISVRTMRNKLRSFIEDGVPVSPAS